MESHNSQVTQTLQEAKPEDFINVKAASGPVSAKPEIINVAVHNLKKDPNWILIISVILGMLLITAIILLILNSNNDSLINGQTTLTPTNAFGNGSPVPSDAIGNTVVPTFTDENGYTADITRIKLDSSVQDIEISKSGDTLILKGEMKGFFEGTMNYRITTDDGEVITNGVITAGDNYEDFATFEKTITIASFSSISSTDGTLEYYDISMKDGSENILAVIPVKFVP